MSMAKNKNKENNGASESKIRKVLFNEVTFCIALISVVFGAYYTFANPQKQTEIILAQQKADFATHEALQKQTEDLIMNELNVIKNGDLVDLNKNLLENRNEIVSLQKEIVKLQVIISERIPVKK
jgi:hypothetical protein